MDYINVKKCTAKPTIPMTKEAFGPIPNTAIYWLAGAGFMINARGTIIMLDPLMKTRPDDPSRCETGALLKVKYPIDADDVPKLDAILYTHSDADHLAEQTSKSLCRLNPKMIGPPPAFERMARMRLDIDLLVSCRSKDIYEYPNVRIEVFPADHPWQLLNPTRQKRIFRAGDSVGFIVETPDVRCFFPGDTRLMEEHLSLFDINFLAFDVSLCTYHLNPLGAKVLANTLKDAYLIPYHYGTIDGPNPAMNGDPATILDEVENGYERALIVAPGEPVVFAGKKLVK